MRRIMLIAAVAMLAALGCEAQSQASEPMNTPGPTATSTATPEPTATPDTGCRTPSPHVVEQISEGFIVEGRSLTGAQAVKSDDWEGVKDGWFVAARIEPTGATGVWFLPGDVTSPDWSSVITSVNTSAQTYTTWGTLKDFQGFDGQELAEQTHGFNEAIACLTAAQG